MVPVPMGGILHLTWQESPCLRLFVGLVSLHEAEGQEGGAWTAPLGVGQMNGLSAASRMTSMRRGL